jgi:hypothetical protein
LTVPPLGSRISEAICDVSNPALITDIFFTRTEETTLAAYPVPVFRPKGPGPGRISLKEGEIRLFVVIKIAASRINRPAAGVGYMAPMADSILSGALDTRLQISLHRLNEGEHECAGPAILWLHGSHADGSP